MGIRVIHDGDRGVMYCSTRERALRPVFHDKDGHDPQERIEAFLDWLLMDPRLLSDNILEDKYLEWSKQETEQWEKKEKEEDERYRD